MCECACVTVYYNNPLHFLCQVSFSLSSPSSSSPLSLSPSLSLSCCVRTTLFHTFILCCNSTRVVVSNGYEGAEVRVCVCVCVGVLFSLSFSLSGNHTQTHSSSLSLSFSLSGNHTQTHSPSLSLSLSLSLEISHTCIMCTPFRDDTTMLCVPLPVMSQHITPYTGEENLRLLT